MLATIAAFGIIASLTQKGENELLESFKGLYFRKPLLAIVFAAAVLSLAGMPLTSGFIAKLLVILTGTGSNNWWLVWLLIINSAIGLFYYLRIVGIMFKKETATQTEKISLPILATLSLALLFLAIVWLGVAPGGFMGLLK
jgi:NADH-quinone oxidoreductase subunit N